MSKLNGWHIQWRYGERAYSYFGRLLRKARVIPLRDLNLDEAYEAGQLTEQEFTELLALDWVVGGRMGKDEAAQDAMLAVEVFYVVDTGDVERAYHRAALLRRLGYNASGAVGGEESVPGVKERAEALGVVVMIDGKM